ncbi:PDZ domain protein [hydrothermal vent metagenome]|uniref:PDZ domain protein n=1 Tax=hydrothermal vent metagenome TaxID=652676 RepID=A0A3B1CF47_9ZZZZ
MSGASGGNIIGTARPDSPAYRAGIRPGDMLLTVNRKRIHDSIDLVFYTDDLELNISVKRKDRIIRTTIIRDEGEDLGIELRPFRIKTCRNRCVFCFVSQLPKGLRRSLYIKDEDFRMSFLYGSYITLSNITPAEKKRIIEQRLSPLYISVHSTDRETRNTLLGNNNATDIMKELKWLAKNRIRIHVQIVLCPGYNDGDKLVSTINDLHKFYPYVSSIAVVPVGLTRHRKSPLKPVGKDVALETVAIISDFQKRFMKKHGDALVYGSDELYIRAEKKFPPLKYYGEFPQIENGVGLVPLFLHKAARIKSVKSPSGQRFLAVTGVSFYPFLSRFIERLNSRVCVDVIPVVNRFFGETVTVAGLLTGRDIIQSVADVSSDYDVLLLPDVIFRDGQDLLLDDTTVEELERILRIRVRVIDPTPRGLINALEE